MDTFFAHLKDFHFLLWLSNELKALGQDELFEQLFSGVIGAENVPDAHDLYRNLIAIANPRVKKPVLKTQRNPSDSESFPKVQENTDETRSQLFMMGYDEELIEEAVKKHGNNLQQAINYILDNASVFFLFCYHSRPFYSFKIN